MMGNMPVFTKREIPAPPIVIHDHAQEPHARFASLQHDDHAEVLRNFASAMERWIVNNIPAPARVFIWLYGVVIRLFGNLQAECDWIAQHGGSRKHVMAAIQRLYTLSHAAACSTVCYWDKAQQEMVCLRSLDWPGADDIAHATRIFDHQHHGVTSHYAVGPVGMLGVLTAVKPGAFSVVINWAASKRGFMGIYIGHEPTFAVRALMEQQPADFNAAVAAACQLKVSSPVFLTICGVKQGEACTVELGNGAAYVRSIGESECLVQTNHYDPQGRNAQCNVARWNDNREQTPAQWYHGKLPHTSGKRQQIIRETLEQGQSPWDAYATAPVWNHECAYWAEMRPARSDQACINAWARG